MFVQDVMIYVMMMCGLVLLQTVRFKNELVRNITIKLGYANAKVRIDRRNQRTAKTLSLFTSIPPLSFPPSPPPLLSSRYTSVTTIVVLVRALTDLAVVQKKMSFHVTDLVAVATLDF